MFILCLTALLQHKAHSGQPSYAMTTVQTYSIKMQKEIAVSKLLKIRVVFDCCLKYYLQKSAQRGVSCHISPITANNEEKKEIFMENCQSSKMTFHIFNEVEWEQRAKFVLTNLLLWTQENSNRRRADFRKQELQDKEWKSVGCLNALWEVNP